MSSRFLVYPEGGDVIFLDYLDGWGGGLFLGFLEGGPLNRCYCVVLHWVMDSPWCMEPLYFY